MKRKTLRFFCMAVLTAILGGIFAPFAAADYEREKIRVVFFEEIASHYTSYKAEKVDIWTLIKIYPEYTVVIAQVR